MSLVKKGASALVKLLIVVALAGTFVVGMFGVVYMSLQGEEIKVPEIVGKDFVASEDELASLGLRIKRRADRYSNEKPNTVLEQLPKAGETVKTGQMILVVTSKLNPEGAEAPATIKKSDDEEDDSEKIEELISDKPKKSTKPSNSNKKKTSTTRDVISENSNENSNSSSGSDSTKKESGSNDNSSKTTKNTAPDSAPKPANPADQKKNAEPKKNPEINKPKPAKTPTGGDTRPRKTP